MKKWFKCFGVIALTLGLQSCYSLGLDAVPDSSASAEGWQVQLCTEEAADFSADGVHWRLSEVLVSPAVVTERNLLGRITRYVQPFTRHTAVFELSIENASAYTLWLKPEQISLVYPDDAEKALDAGFFEAVWPAAAVRSSQEMLDRSQAIAEVYRSLLRERPVLPGESYHGRLAFRRHRQAPHTLNIQGQRLGQKTLTAQFCLRALRPAL